ncbi:YycH family regulatory protein [Planococcus lenghuensis]|uniref:Regulatory protein YycH domain-containing protein n=1 Tax=Planococcus lenghuensis TaxID=2213202 RepID=A0A1Q2L390_9BACL|nr:two-component system activity regulator YycH [Planococcus lenghuensis]AQQ54910.1 hypothetical protein B0X71_18580 [Planococcus lenghuensis]
MKYVEQIKSAILLALVVLSVYLTFTVWTYKPNLDTFDQPEVLEEPIAETRTLEEVVKPLKILFHGEDVTTGTIEAEEISFIRSALREWIISDVTLLAEETSADQLASFLYNENSVVLQYPAPVPFPVYDAYMQFSVESSIPEASFDRVVINWGGITAGEPALYFIDTTSNRIYTAIVAPSTLQNFQDRVVAAAADYPVYALAENVGMWPVFVPAEPLQLPIYSYFPEEMYEQFHEVLVESAEGSGDDPNGYITQDTETKSLSFVQAEVRTGDPAIMSELVFNTLDFLNEHGGWTDDYRYFGIKPLDQNIQYQLFVAGLPVFSDTLETTIEQWWGNRGVYVYLRPYYELDALVTQNVEQALLASGIEAAEEVRELEGLELEEVQNIVPAYQMTISADQRVLVLKPAWYYQTEDAWLPVVDADAGGIVNGLE